MKQKEFHRFHENRHLEFLYHFGARRRRKKEKKSRLRIAGNSGRAGPEHKQEKGWLYSFATAVLAKRHTLGGFQQPKRVPPPSFWRPEIQAQGALQGHALSKGFREEICLVSSNGRSSGRPLAGGPGRCNLWLLATLPSPLRVSVRAPSASPLEGYVWSPLGLTWVVQDKRPLSRSLT